MEKKTEKVHDLHSTLIFEEEESEVSQAEKKAKKKAKKKRYGRT